MHISVQIYAYTHIYEIVQDLRFLQLLISSILLLNLILTFNKSNDRININCVNW
jgi:hypothetical protein